MLEQAKKAVELLWEMAKTQNKDQLKNELPKEELQVSTRKWGQASMITS